MKIFYAVQATGNGHISRAMELVPQLQEYGHVDIFLSGSNGTLELDLPIKYRSKGLSLHYNCKGGLDFWKVFRGYEPFRMKQEIRDLPVEKYDLVLNDFDYITAAACARKKIPSIQFGHQASFQSLHTPRPLNRSMAGEWILDNYAKATTYVGLHFKAYDDFIFTPIIKSEIRTAEPSDKNHVTVYLPSYCEAQLTTIFQQFRDIRFEIFCFETKQPKSVNNIRFIPVNKTLFNNSFIHCTGLITGGGFETPAEAIHLGKKLMTIPIRGQYEQQCNAAALTQLGIKKLASIDNGFGDHLYAWMNSKKVIQMDYSNSIGDSLAYVFANIPVRENIETYMIE